MIIDDRLISKPPYAGPDKLKSKEVSREEMVSLVSELFKVGESREDAKATGDEPPPDVRGKPLSKDEALADSEITQDDVEKAQAWVDKAMKEAGFVD